MNSIKYHIDALKITFQELFKGNYLIFFIPGAVLTVIYLLFSYHTSLVAETFLMQTDDSWTGWAKGILNSGVESIFDFFGFMVDQIYIFAVITLLSPFSTVLSERLDTKLTGTKYNSSIARFINDIIRMVFVVMIAVTLEISFLVFYYIISLIFGLAVIDGIMFFVITAFFYGMAFYDFALERDQAGVFGTLGFAFSKPISMILTGSIFLIIYSIPLIGVPISPVITVMVSTIVYLYITKKIPKQTELKTTENNE
jgi:CysZ protein